MHFFIDNTLWAKIVDVLQGVPAKESRVVLNAFDNPNLCKTIEDPELLNQKIKQLEDQLKALSPEKKP